ncbi:1-acyl-sn-glycerol-3-phosphate acyltransferase LPAT1, chloroplastic-like [Lolium rigidum]|uniref:1-acyl-sn-glycerol-3-phosphate acyltransferase LPAT1, chloroplastic-like n=1 Tax=Lolium rigidum TaxID=89674 RepID=UPI001F5CA80E|nr:1-acyl-sn-glycerol-3-phosphate acyltransferase LPAT1, chloroplastic-like [Lolium rigidum]
MGTLLWPRPATTAFAPPIAAGPSAAHVVAGGGVKGRPRRVSLALRCPDQRPRVIQDGRGRWAASRSYVAAGGAAAAAGDSSRALPDLQMASRIRGVFFYMVTSAAAIVLFIAMVVVHPLVLLFDRHRRRAQHYIAKIWATLAISMFYKLEFEGMENLPPNTSPAVYVANHQSFLDIYTLLTLGRCFKFISKTSIFMIPIIGWAMYLLGVIPLRRMDSRSQLDCLKRCVDLVKRGASVFFFPEGTRSKDGKLGVFKRGAFSVAAKTGVPVVPITLLGTGKLMPPGMEGNLNSGSVKVIIHRPVEGDNAEKLCSNARSVIADTLLLHGYGVH